MYLWHKDSANECNRTCSNCRAQPVLAYFVSKGTNNFRTDNDSLGLFRYLDNPNVNFMNFL